MDSSELRVPTLTSLKDLYCIEYPGIVQNLDRAMETLGGINSVSNVFANKQKKLELRFRPDNMFCTAASGECTKSGSILIKVTIRRKKFRDKNIETEMSVTNVSIVGRILKTINFKNLMDYQYFPIELNCEGKPECIYSSIVPNKIVSASWLNEPAPLFLLPSFFSRIESIQPYLSLPKNTEESLVVGRMRDRRSNYVKFASFDIEKVPSNPHPGSLRYVETKLVSEDEIFRIKKLFDERPVWTKSAIAFMTRFGKVQMKYLLALASYYFTSGPFRIAWVKFGYDPRQHPEAMKYQVIDFRVRSNLIPAIRELFPEWSPAPKSRAPKSDEDIRALKENCYIFKPGFIPPHRQIFYQITDIQIPEVIAKLRQYSRSKLSYDPKFGWLNERLYEFIRDQIDKHILAILEQNTPGCSSETAFDIRFHNLKSVINESSDDDDESSSSPSVSSASDQDDAVLIDNDHIPEVDLLSDDDCSPIKLIMEVDDPPERCKEMQNKLHSNSGITISIPAEMNSESNRS